MSEQSEGRILTFYSYKGGTGRTMALANVAWILASRGKRVLLIDWDVEAPGLHRYFAPFLSDPTLSETDGLMEFLAQYVVSATKELPASGKGGEIWYQPHADIKRYAEPLQWQFPDGGGIDLVGAGRQNASYGTRVNGFDWDGFYSRFGGGAFLDESARQMKAAYDYVLIDSRTGISDTSGICTIHLPDALVVFYTLNNQSIEGASAVAAHVLANRMGPSRKPFRIWSMATRVELAEKKKLEARRLFARERFSPFLETLEGLSGQTSENYWGDMEILYDPFYAYEEILATIADLPGRTNSVLAAFERLCSRITNGQVSRLGEISETKRSEALELSSLTETSQAALNVPKSRKPKDWDIFLSASASDSAQAERLYYLLGSTYKVFHAPKEIAPGDIWVEAIMEALEHSGAMVLLFSAESARGKSKWMSAEIEAARHRLERDPSFKLIPVQLDPGAVPPDDFLESYHWLSARGKDMQDVAVQLRRSLGRSGSNDSDNSDDSDRTIRMKAELQQALEEKATLAARVEELQREVKQSQQEMQQVSSERAALAERTKNQIREADEFRAEALASENNYRRQSRRARCFLGATLALLLIAMFWAQYTFLRQRTAKGLLDATKLAAASYEVGGQDKELSLALAVTAVETAQNPRTIAALRGALRETVENPRALDDMTADQLLKKAKATVSGKLTSEQLARYLAN